MVYRFTDQRTEDKPSGPFWLAACFTTFCCQERVKSCKCFLFSPTVPRGLNSGLIFITWEPSVSFSQTADNVLHKSLGKTHPDQTCCSSWKTCTPYSLLHHLLKPLRHMRSFPRGCLSHYSNTATSLVRRFTRASRSSTFALCRFRGGRSIAWLEGAQERLEATFVSRIWNELSAPAGQHPFMKVKALVRTRFSS